MKIALHRGSVFGIGNEEKKIITGYIKDEKRKKQYCEDFFQSRELIGKCNKKKATHC